MEKLKHSNGCANVDSGQRGKGAGHGKICEKICFMGSNLALNGVKLCKILHILEIQLMQDLA